jgi:hypothetical protein
MLLEWYELTCVSRQVVRNGRSARPTSEIFADVQKGFWQGRRLADDLENVQKAVLLGRRG